MKQGIKILVALFFILCSFGLGKYSCEEECKINSANLVNDINQLKVENIALKDTIIILNDSISLLQMLK